MPDTDVVRLQKALNVFTAKYLKHVTALRVDGDKGAATRKRIRDCKYYLGYVKSRRDGKAGAELLYRLKYPKSPKYGGAHAVARGIRRRVAQRRRAAASHKAAFKRTGVGHFDGKTVANWLIPYLQWARAHGWRGTVTSGWRDPVYSQHLCYSMCGRPSCPGRCAGLASNHVGSVAPHGAVDVTYYGEFGQIIKSCPYSPRIYNALGSADPVHFSSSGR